MTTYQLDMCLQSTLMLVWRLIACINWLHACGSVAHFNQFHVASSCKTFATVFWTCLVWELFYKLLFTFITWNKTCDTLQCIQWVFFFVMHRQLYQRKSFSPLLGWWCWMHLKQNYHSHNKLKMFQSKLNWWVQCASMSLSHDSKLDGKPSRNHWMLDNF